MMYVTINRLDAEKFAKLDFAINFGIDPQVRKLVSQALLTGGGYEWTCEHVFAQVPIIQLLKLHKYLNWADKKLHSMFFIENKDDINEDLLADFNEEDSGKSVKTGLTQPLDQDKSKSKGSKKPVGIEVTKPMFVSHHELLFGAKPGTQQ